MKLQAKLLWIAAPLIVAPLLTVGWIAYSQLYKVSSERTLNQMTTLLDQLGRNVQAKLQTAQANIRLFSNSILLQRYVMTGDEQERYELLQPTLLQQFNSYQQAYPDYYEIRILLPDGYEDTRATRGPIRNVAENEANTPYFRELQTQRGNAYTRFYQNPDTGETALLLAQKLLIKEPYANPIVAKPLLRGYLAITVSLEFMRQQVQNNRLGSNGWIFYIDGGGRILFHPFEGYQGAQLSGELLAQLWHSAATGETMSAIHRGGQTLFQVRQLHEQLYLVGALPQTEFLAASRELGAVVTVATVISILLTSALLLIILKYLLVRPIQKLSKATQEIGAGRLDTLIDIDTRDEIGDLARSFREMAHSVRRSKDQISHIAYHDSLTGLANRLLFKEYLAHALADAKRRRQSLALLFLDLDKFKHINDTLGHHAGDDLLKEIALRLNKSLREEDWVARAGTLTAAAGQSSDLVARLGGDEFLVLLTNLGDPHDAERVAARILKALEPPVSIGRHEVFVSTSIGISIYPSDGATVDTLIRNADLAMYHAKENGRNNFKYYSESLNDAAIHRLTIDTRLRRALERQELMLHYQPQIEVATGRIIGCEALLRWQDSELGWVSPTDFILLAEESGLIIQISEWVVREACRQTKAWQTVGFDGLFTSINISGVHVNRAEVAELVAQALQENGLDAHCLEIELTETSVMTAREAVAEKLEKIRALGVGIALDDFGTGYSSLSHLRRLPLDKLKIDRSFLRNLPDDRDDAAIVSAIVAMARSLKLSVTAEGVETSEQLALLQAEGCQYAQGFFFGCPVTPQAFEELLVQQSVRLGPVSMRTAPLPSPGLINRGSRWNPGP